ncbi:putative bifunctional diguanylate cyclase/phosphodiesterase [Actinomycetospora callitridis]|uniref:putative bifunctional diguanylate cyclase/phosphodiesterase n=1 Tax=Actinomycetospora callitridis TaxID=913944 RepID=UPI002365E060|nr:EAL domain-containing protein [Actinomycetospora callitridis]MDD7919827.1 EAL domain-containing protein [Actinomycetospora callitridis]
MTERRAAGPAPPDRDTLDVLAARWAEEVEGTSYVPMAADELQEHLLELAGLVVEAVRAEPPRPEVGAEVGRRLVAAHFTGPSTLERTVVLLAERLPLLYGPEVRPAVHALTGALAAGYAATLRDRTLDEQEAIRRAVLVARQHTEQALHASEARFRAMFHEAAIGIGLGDMKGRILEVNPAMTRMFGHTADEFRELTVGELAHPDDAPAVWRLYERLLRGELDNFRIEKRFFRRDGEVIVGHLTLSLVRDEEGKPSYQLAMLEDVSERHRLQQHLTYQAYHDPLTTLANRARFTERLERVFADAGPHSTRRVGVCYLDLDGFKTINDSLGHHIGDLMLQEVARRLGACAGEGELVARTGGDEFVVLVEDSQGVDRLVGLADRVLAALAPPLRLAGQELAVGASIGVVEQAVTDTTASELMRAADITLYTAKAEGRGRWAVHDPDRDEAETARFTLSAALPMAVAHDEFFVLYQPLVSLSDHRVRGVEALVRWQHPRLGVLSPALFIGPAEETGVIVPLGRSVLETACRDARDWHAEFGSAAPFVSVNVAPRQLHEPGLVAEVAALLDRTGLPPDRLQVELTERALTTDEGAPLKALDGLRAMGVRIAVDDFGTGYSNLSYLRKLPVDVIKLDGSFGEGLREEELYDEVDERIVGTLVDLGHALDLTVTAEGVETAAQAARLRELGCDEGQGWLFAPALPAGDVATMLRRGEPLGELTTASPSRPAALRAGSRPRRRAGPRRDGRGA